MKKTRKLLSIIGATLALASCGKNQSLCEEDVFYQGADAYTPMVEVLGDYASSVPTLSTYNVVESKWNYSEEADLKYVTTNYYVNDWERSYSIYNAACKNLGFTLQNSAQYDNAKQFYAFKSVSIETMLVLQVTGVEETIKNDPMLTVIAYTYMDKLTEWPADKVVEAIGQDIPHIDAQYYQYQIQQITETENAIYVLAYGEKELEDQYYQILRNNDYVIRQSSLTVYNAINHEKKIQLQFMYDEDYGALVIAASKVSDDAVWPVELVREYLGVDLPIYSDPAVSYQYIDWAKETTITEGQPRLEIDCVFAPLSCLDAYCEMVEAEGWIQGDVILSSDLCFMGFKYSKVVEGKTLNIDVVRFYDKDNASGYNQEQALVIYIY